MTTPLETVWKNDYANPAKMPQVGDSSWKQNLSNYLGDLLDDLLSLETYISPGVPAYPAFLFGRSAFASALTDTNGIVGLQSAFEAGVNASTFIIPIGTTFELVPTLATTFSTVGLAVVDTDSIDAGKAKIAELSSAPQVSDPLDSQFPIKLRAAFLLLTYTVGGTNSVIPTPATINDEERAVV